MKFLFLIVILFGFFSVSKAYGATSTNVDATVKISVCGNMVAENGEECDNTDLKGKTCQALGFGSGTLKCDVSCSLDTSACVVATPTPTPIASVPTAIPTVAPTAQPATEAPKQTVISEIPTSTIQPNPTEATVPLPSPNQNIFTENILAPLKGIPQKLFYFGADNNGLIAQSQLPKSVQLWVAQWQNFLANFTLKEGKMTGQDASNQCDINNDRVCNLVDLSIMLYHVQQ